MFENGGRKVNISISVIVISYIVIISAKGVNKYNEKLMYLKR